MGDHGLSSAFVAAGGVAGESGDALEQALTSRSEAARAAWPAIALAPQDFVAHLATHARDAGALPPLEHAGDLFLACACAAGVPGAVEAFHKTFASSLLRSAERVNRSNADQTVQRVLERLLVRTPERAPKIAEFGGRSKLSRWLAAVSAREALNGRRRIDDQSHDSLSSIAGAAPSPSPELAILRARHGEDFRQAIRAALGRLEPRDRALLRMNLAAGLSLEQVAEVYKVSRATVARWLAAARLALQKETHKELLSRLRLTPAELESLVAVIRSEIELSMGTLLAESEG